MRSMVNRYADRVSVSFSDDAADVDCIVSVTFNLRAANGLDDAAITYRAWCELESFADRDYK